MAKRVKWPNNERSEALGTRLLTIDPTDQPHLQDASPFGQWLFSKVLALLAHCWPSPYGLGHQLHHQTEAWKTLLRVVADPDLKTAI